MLITVFGASGKTGQAVVKQALAMGYRVIAFVRSPSKLAIKNPNLTVVVGEISDAAAVARAVRGVDAVISVLGPSQNAAGMPVSAGTRNIIAAMQEQNVHRLIVSTGAGVLDANDAPDWMAKAMGALVRVTARHVYEDMAQVAYLVRTSRLDWTLVRAPMLTDGNKKGNARAAWVGKGMGRQVTRADLADFMLQQLTDKTYVHQAPAVSNG